MNKKKVKRATPKNSRRAFFTSAAALGVLPILPSGLKTLLPIDTTNANTEKFMPMQSDEKSIIGSYGQWAADLAKNPPTLSFRNTEVTDIDDWRQKAMAKTNELLAAPTIGSKLPKVILISKYEYDGLAIEELEWQLPYGKPTKAVVLKPLKATRPLPAVLALHDHGGQKYFGIRKIVKTSDDLHPMMKNHHETYYSGKAWANELAKSGYVVLVHDVFTFGSRRVLRENISGIAWGACSVEENETDNHTEASENILAYNTWASDHEHIMSKSLFCSGTTWPGVSLVEDQTALSILSNRTDVDEMNIGCCGLSGGGLRANYLGGLDHRIKCAIAVGFMTTWRDFLYNKAFTHTWMIYTPLLANYLNFPEIMGLRTPLPTMTLNNNEDSLFTLSEMKKADRMLQEVFDKAGASAKYSGKFYSGPHKFDKEMQSDAFAWFDKWLK